MLEKVAAREASFNNPASISQSPFKSRFKLAYYNLFALLYRIMGSFTSLVFVNSTWTKNHIDVRWPRSNAQLLYPPVDCAQLSKLPIGNREKMIISIGQFRPEKNHMLQLEAFARYLELTGDTATKLIMIGSVRKHEPGDEERVQKLLTRAQELNLGV